MSYLKSIPRPNVADARCMSFQTKLKKKKKLIVNRFSILFFYVELKFLLVFHSERVW